MASALITALDIALRDKRASVSAWIRWRGSKLLQDGRLTQLWDGHSVRGDAIDAIVDHSRWLAICPVCGNAEYVDPDTPVFYCLGCGNGDDTAARPVRFPEGRARIEAALLQRPVLEGRGANRIEMLKNAKAAFGDLPRNWRPGVSAETLEAENLARGV